MDADRVLHIDYGGAVVHCFPDNARTCAFEVECVDSNGKTIWLETFEQDDLNQVVPDHQPMTTRKVASP